MVRPSALAVFMLMAAAMAQDRQMDDRAIIERLVKRLHAEFGPDLIGDAGRRIAAAGSGRSS
jgi:hypothetical protein